MLDKNEFSVLAEIEKTEYKLTQRELSDKLGCSVGLVKK